MEQYEKNIARLEKEYAMSDLVKLRIEVARLDERQIAADKALALAEGKVSRTAMVSVITIIIAVLALAIQFIKR